VGSLKLMHSLLDALVVDDGTSRTFARRRTFTSFFADVQPSYVNRSRTAGARWAGRPGA
jgi:hypothetical protein